MKLNVLIFPVNIWGVGVWPRSGFSLLVSCCLRGCRRRKKCQPRWICPIHSDTHSRSPPSSPHAVSNTTTQFSPSNSVLLIRSYQPMGKGNPHPPPAPTLSSLSRHCCCEDEMSVLLKVPLKHNSDLWCLIVSFQSYARARAHPHAPRSFQSSDWLLGGGGHNFRRTDTMTRWCYWEVLVHH